jgi:hypothetical protein
MTAPEVSVTVPEILPVMPPQTVPVARSDRITKVPNLFFIIDSSSGLEFANFPLVRPVYPDKTQFSTIRENSQSLVKLRVAGSKIEKGCLSTYNMTVDSVAPSNVPSLRGGVTAAVPSPLQELQGTNMIFPDNMRRFLTQRKRLVKQFNTFHNVLNP